MSAGALLLTAPGVAAPDERNDVGDGTCCVDGCEKPGVRLGACWGHYKIKRRYGSYDYKRPTQEETFWSNVDRSAGPNACWHWKRYLNAQGYGHCNLNGANTCAHRHAWRLTNGPIPEGLVIDHMCHNRDLRCPGGDTCPHRACCNPAHLRAVSHSENVCAHWEPRKEQATHCINGHPYIGENVVRENGHRRCAICKLATKERAKGRRRQAK